MKAWRDVDFDTGRKLEFLNNLEVQIIGASPSILCMWEKAGLLNRIHEIKLQLVDPVEQVEQREVLVFEQRERIS